MDRLRIQVEKKADEIVWTDTPFDHLKGRGVIVTDENLARIYQAQLANHDVVVIEAGEGSKSLSMAGHIVERLIERRLGRGDYVAAFGGGVIGDLTGFVASIYKRGCRFYQIPTSLIAVVDSSIGGKTAVNHADHKNSVGTFYSSERVLINLNFLETLPRQEWINGCGEILKYAFLDEGVYRQVTEGAEIDWPNLIRACIEVKKRYVEADYYDKGLRQHLNLGHTYGHAIERYDGTSHGIAVAYGIKMIIESYGLTHLKHAFDRLCSRLNIELTKEYDKADLEPYLMQDKKNNQEKRVFIVPDDIGTMRIVEVKHEV